MTKLENMTDAQIQSRVQHLKMELNTGYLENPLQELLRIVTIARKVVEIQNELQKRNIMTVEPHNTPNDSHMS